MRNLKKVLSLALAMVMLLGMMVVGAGAVTQFKDDSSIPEERWVAAAVSNTIGVLVGDEEGNFKPEDTLTRAEAAVILTRLDLGADAASALTATNAATFDDVGAGYGWAKAYIDYCAGNDYMVGVGGNRFAPADPLTGVQFGTMLCRVLGYVDKNEGVDGANWTAVKAAALARKAGLGADVAIDSNPISRADMAQMVLNALTSPMVEYTGLNISGGDFSISSPATVRTHTSNTAGYNYTYDGEVIKPNITPIRLCEEKFPTLKLDRSGENDFKEAYSVWKYKGVEISESKVALSYISTTQKETNNAWMTNVKNPLATNFIAYLNGEEITTVKTVSDITALTGNGRLVEVYVDPDDLSSVEKVVVIDTVPAEVTKVDSEGKLTVKLLATDSEVIDKDGAIVSADAKRNDLLNTNDKTVIDGEFKKGDLVLVNAYGKKQICKDSTVATVFAPEKREEFVIRKNYKDGKAVSVDTGDTTDIKDARNVITEFNIDAFSVNNKNKDSVLYLDKYGYIVKIVDWVDTTPQDGLIAIADIYQDVEGRKIVNRVSGVIANGETIELVYNKEGADASKPVVGKIFTYSELSNGVYELDPVVDTKTPVSSLGDKNDKYVANVWDAAKDLTFRSNDTKGNANTYASRNFYSDSVKFIFADEANKDVTVLKGRQAYSEKLNVVAHALDKRGEIIAVFLEAEPDFVSLDDIIFVWEKKSKDEVVGTDDQTIYYGYTAFNSDGSEIDDFFGTANNMDNAPDGKFYKKDTVKDGDIVAYKPTGSTNEKVLAHTITSSMITYANGTRGDSFIIGGGTDKEIELLTNSKTVVVDLATDRTITTPAELNQTMNRERKAVKVAVVYTYDKDAKTYDVSTIFVTEVGDTGSFDKVEVIPNAPKSYTVTIKEAPTQFDVTVTKADGTEVKSGEKVTENTVLTLKAESKVDGKVANLTVDSKPYTETTLTVTNNVTISAELGDKPVVPVTDLNVVLDPDSAAAKAGVSIAGVHVVTTEENSATGGTYNGKGVGTAIITLKVPAGVTVSADAVVNAKLTWTDGGFSYEKAAEAITAGDTTVDVKPGTGKTFDTDLTYTLTGLGVAVTHKVEVKSDVKGLTFSTSTDSADETTGGDLKLAIKGVPAYATKVDVYFTVEGLAAGTLKGTKDAATGYQKLNMTANKGAISEAAIADDGSVKADPKADNVVITIKDVKVTEQTAKITGATPATLTITTGQAFGLPELTVALGGAVKTADALVTIEGVTTDDSSGFPTTNRKMTLTAGKTADESASGKHYTSDGKSEVTITVKPVVTALDKASTSFEKAGFAVDSVEFSDDVTVENGTNTNAVNLVVKKTANFTDAKKYSVEIVSGADKITFTTAAAVSGSATTRLTLPVAIGDLKNITGDKLVVVVTEITP